MTNGSLGIWLFIASEVMLFGGLFSAYVLLRAGSASWPPDIGLSWLGPLVGTILLIAASWGLRKETRTALALTCGVIFLALTAFEWATMLDGGSAPRSSVFAGLYYAITGTHALHVLGGVVAMTMRRTNRKLLSTYWLLVDLVWLGILVAFY